jgi:hypothetical protein
MWPLSSHDDDLAVIFLMLAGQLVSSFHRLYQFHNDQAFIT